MRNERRNQTPTIPSPSAPGATGTNDQRGRIVVAVVGTWLTGSGFQQALPSGWVIAADEAATPDYLVAAVESREELLPFLDLVPRDRILAIIPGHADVELIIDLLNLDVGSCLRASDRSVIAAHLAVLHRARLEARNRVPTTRPSW